MDIFCNFALEAKKKLMMTQAEISAVGKKDRDLDEFQGELDEEKAWVIKKHPELTDQEGVNTHGEQLDNQQESK